MHMHMHTHTRTHVHTRAHTCTHVYTPQVIVFHGETIAAWRNQGYHETADHQNFRDLLHAPKQDAACVTRTDPPHASPSPPPPRVLLPP